jgi:hypothetical protein
MTNPFALSNKIIYNTAIGLVCYAYWNEKGELQAPFMDYLEKYAIREGDSERRKGHKAKQVMNLKAHLEYLVDCGGDYNKPPFIQKYHGRSVGILKISESGGLVRIAFFVKRGNTIILLDAMDKPKLYEKAKKAQVDKKIDRFLDRVERYRADHESKNQSLPLIL